MSDSVYVDYLNTTYQLLNLLCDETLIWHPQSGLSNGKEVWKFDHDKCEFQWGNDTGIQYVLFNASAAFSNADNYPLILSMIVEPLYDWEYTELTYYINPGYDGFQSGSLGGLQNFTESSQINYIFTAPNYDCVEQEILTKSNGIYQNKIWSATSCYNHIGSTANVQNIGIADSARSHPNEVSGPFSIIKGFYFSGYPSLTSSPSTSPSIVPPSSPSSNPSVAPTTPTAITSVDPTSDSSSDLAPQKNYYFVNVLLNWSMAESYCQTECNSHLLSIHSYIDHVMAATKFEDVSNLNKFPEIPNFDRYGLRRAWIGIHDTAQEMSFSWTDGSPFDYGNETSTPGVYPWTDDSPRNVSVFDNDQDCGNL